MFKINKLNSVSNEKVVIDYVVHDVYTPDNGIVYSFKTLSFSIEGNLKNEKCTFSFELNCKPEELLSFANGETINFRKYLCWSETYITINDVTDTEPDIEITINRYLKNRFTIYIKFNCEINNDVYSGIIEFNFDLDNYL